VFMVEFNSAPVSTMNTEKEPPGPDQEALLLISRLSLPWL